MNTERIKALATQLEISQEFQSCLDSWDAQTKLAVYTPKGVVTLSGLPQGAIDIIKPAIEAVVMTSRKDLDRQLRKEVNSNDQ